MIIWPSKDPDEVADYSWSPTLDAGDTIASYTAVLASGDVVKASDSLTGGKVTLWLSGGSPGSISTFTLRVVTAGGRTFETTAQISIVESSSAFVSSFRMRFPTFAAVPDAVVQYWLTDAGLIVTDTWDAVDYEPALLTLAAHNMALLGLDKPANDAVGNIAAMGVTSFKSASMSVNFAEGVISANAAGGYGATKYGKDFQVYLRRNRGGPRLVGCP